MSQRILKNWFIPLLILLAFVGGRVADACDFSDYHVDLKKPHVEGTDNSACDADSSKRKVDAHICFAPVEWVFLLPPVAPLSSEVVHFICSSVASPVALPARAPPA